MAAGCGWIIPRLDGVCLEQQLWQGEATAARLVRTLIEANVADPGEWVTAKKNPFDFIKRALDGWLSQHGDAVIREQQRLLFSRHTAMVSTTVAKP